MEYGIKSNSILIIDYLIHLCWRIVPKEYGEFGDSTSQEWIYAIKIIYKKLLQEKRWRTDNDILILDIR